MLGRVSMPLEYTYIIYVKVRHEISPRKPRVQRYSMITLSECKAYGLTIKLL
jgi:hypothetical protein